MGELKPEREQSAIAELAAARADLARGVTRLIDSYVKDLGKTTEEAIAAGRRLPPWDPAERPPDQVHWSELAQLIEQEPDRGIRLWEEMRRVARRELASGTRVARALEPRLNGRPWERARFAALIGALRDDLQPRGPVEDLLVQQMAAALEGWLRWQTAATERVEESAWEGERDRRRALEHMSPAQRERHQDDHGWLPPRQGTAEAIEQATILADRYLRAYLRLLKAYRDNRRLFGALIVTGGQVNVGEQQINVAAGEGVAPPGEPGEGAGTSDDR